MVVGLVVTTSCARLPEMRPSATTLTPTKLPNTSLLPKTSKDPHHNTAAPTESVESTRMPETISDIAQSFPSKAQLLEGPSESPSHGRLTSTAGGVLTETPLPVPRPEGGAEEYQGGDRDTGVAGEEDDGDADDDREYDGDDVDDDTDYDGDGDVDDDTEYDEYSDEDDEYEYVEVENNDDDIEYTNDGDDDYDESDYDNDQSDDSDEHNKYGYSGWEDGDDYDDDDSGENNEIGNEDDSGGGRADGMVYMFLQGNESSVLSPFYISDLNDSRDALGGSERLSLPPGTLKITDINIDNETLDDNEVIDDGKHKNSAGFPYLVNDGYVPRGDTVIVLSDEQLRTLVGATAAAAGNETENEVFTDRYEKDNDMGDEATTAGPYSTYTFFMEDGIWNTTVSPSLPSVDMIDIHNKTEYITEEELDEILKIYEDFVITGGEEEWEANDDGEPNGDNAAGGNRGSVAISRVGKESDSITENSLNAALQDIEEKQSSEQDDVDIMTTPLATPAAELHKTTIRYQTDEEPAVTLSTSGIRLYADPDVALSSQNNITYNFSRIYEDLIKSNELSKEEKLNLTILERLRRTVESMGSVEAFRKNPKVHHIVKRQLIGNEACGVFSRRRRDVETVDPASQWSRTKNDKGGSVLVRRRRGVSNVGRRLEQGNVGYRQLYNQYKNMCTFIAMTVFEK